MGLVEESIAAVEISPICSDSSHNITPAASEVNPVHIAAVTCFGLFIFFFIFLSIFISASGNIIAAEEADLNNASDNGLTS